MEFKSEYQIFDYIDFADCFVVNKEFERVNWLIGLNEWHAVVWLGRAFISNNDFGEHWFDNWDERDKLFEKHKNQFLEIGIEDEGELMILLADRMAPQKLTTDGPCHSPEVLKKIWTDVLKSLKISKETLIALSMQENKLTREAVEDAVAKGAIWDGHINT